MKRFGMTGNVSASTINDFIALKENTFVENGNLNLLTQSFKDKFNQALNLGFKAKGISKKTQAYVDLIETTRQDNYSGRWYRDGWFSQKNLVGGDFSFSYTDNIFYSRDNLPYTNEASTGLYIDEYWSGYNFSFDASNEVIGGFIRAGASFSSERTRPFPYKNINEIFDHSGIQIGDMGTNIAYTDQETRNLLSGQTVGYEIGERIGYNRIFFLSGLNRDNINNYDYRILLIADKNKFNKRKNITSAEQIVGKIEEEPNQPRYNVFFYTGNLNVKYTPILTNIPNTLGWGEFYGTRLTTSLDVINSGFNIKCSGTYPQYFEKDFYIYNTGAFTQRFYFGISDTGIISTVSDFEPSESNYQWSYEQDGLLSGRKLNSYLLGKDSVAYFSVKINTKDMTGDLNSNFILKNENIFIYRATGENLQPNFTGLKSQQFSVPVSLAINLNNANIFSDDILYDFSSGRYTPYSLKGDFIYFTRSGILNKNNKSFGLTLYATGGALENPVIKNDLHRKINRLGEYSSTGIFSNIKTIYPLKQAETYYYVESDVSWMRNLNSATQIFRWISGFSGFFTGNRNFNPFNGAIQQDIRFTIDTPFMLPARPNTSGSNFTVKFQDGNMLFNNLGIGAGFDFIRGKRYRFLQINSGNSHPLNIQSDQARVFEPEYNKKTYGDYRLIEFNPNLNTPDLVSWNAGEQYYSGNFRIHGGEEKIVNFKANINLTGKVNEYNVIPFTYNLLKFPMYYNNNNLPPGRRRSPAITGYTSFVDNLRYTPDNITYKLMKNIKLEKDKYYAFVNRFDISNTDASNFGIRFWTGSMPYNKNNLYNFSEQKDFYTVSGQSRVNIHTFKVSDTLPNNVKLYVGITGGEAPLGLPVDIINPISFTERTGNYSELTYPIFSGNLKVYTSNVNNNFNLPVILFGAGYGIDHLTF